MSALASFNRLKSLPGGTRLFSRGVCFAAPYFASIHPHVEVLEPDNARVSIKKRRAVTNHLGTVHAIAMCNMAELAGGLMTDVSIPATHRWIPKGMTVEYLKKAETDLVATARPTTTPDFAKAGEYPVQVEVTDTSGQAVFRALITMWVSPKKA